MYYKDNHAIIFLCFYLYPDIFRPVANLRIVNIPTERVSERAAIPKAVSYRREPMRNPSCVGNHQRQVALQLILGEKGEG